MARRIALYGGAFNPPHLGHRAVAQCVSRNAARFGISDIPIVACGGRPEKQQTNDIDPVHRAAMCVKTFGDIPLVTVDNFDLENREFTRLGDLDAKYSADGAEVLHVIGTDNVVGGARGESDIQTKWRDGRALWGKLHFAVVPRKGYPITKEELPPKAVLLETEEPEGLGGASSDIRLLSVQRKSIEEFVARSVAKYIERYGLYRYYAPSRTTQLTLGQPHVFFHFDDRNPEAVAFVEKHSYLAVPIEQANCIVSVGGDGTMLRAVREHWHRYLPFVGVNKGHVGYLLNDEELFDGNLEKLLETLVVHQLMQLSVTMVNRHGRIKHDYAFNDAWVRDRGQSSWLDITADGSDFSLDGDGALVATAAGSTGYAWSMGAMPMLVDTQNILLVGNNVQDPRGWKYAPLAMNANVDIVPAGGRKRMVMGFVDGRPHGIVTRMTCQSSLVAGVELAFSPQRDLRAKLHNRIRPHRIRKNY